MRNEKESGIQIVLFLQYNLMMNQSLFSFFILVKFLFIVYLYIFFT